MYYDKIFIRRDLKAFLSEMIISFNDAFVIRFENAEQLKSYAHLIPMQFSLMKDKGKGIKHILYCYENMQKNSDESHSIDGLVVKMDGAELVGSEDFTCKFSDYSLDINSSLINVSEASSLWRENIYLHLDEQKQKEYMEKCANILPNDKELITK